MEQEQTVFTYIGIATQGGQTFTNASSNDLIMFTPEPSKLLLGTHHNLSSQLEINTSRLVINDDATVYGDFLVTNNKSAAVLSLQQSSNSSTVPFVLYQTANGDAYIMNTRNTYIGSQGIGISNTSNFTRHILISSNGSIGIGTSNPRQKLDVFQGNVNAQNVMRLRKSVASSNPVNININWTSNVVGPQYSVILETTQQYGTPVYQGTRKQDHKFTLSSPFNHTPQVARGFGDKESYTSMFITASNTSPTSMSISSTVIGAPAAGTSNITHELDVNIIIAPSVLGHVWMS